MAYDRTTPIAGNTLGTADAWITYIHANGGQRMDEVERFVREVYRLAPPVGIAAHLTVAQMIHETDAAKSYWWLERLNPGGIGITGDPKQNKASRIFPNGTIAARAMMVHVALYVLGTLPEELAPYREEDPRADAVPKGALGKRTTLGDFGSDGSVVTWAVDPAYGDKWARRMREAEAAGVLKGTVPAPHEEEPKMARPRLLIVSGHRSASDGGNPAERDLTDDMARAYMSEAEGRGYQASWWQRDLDGDSNPTMTDPGGLDRVARGCAAVLSEWHKAEPDRMFVMLDLHYNGGSSVIHAIPPGSEGLSTAYAGGAPAVDSTANNTLDVKVGATWARHCNDATGRGVFVGANGTPGIMLERETGVGLDGWRLAMHAATAGNQQYAVRLVLEHGGYNDRYGKDFARWADAAFDAFDEVFEVTGDTPNPPVDPKPEPKYLKPEPPTWWPALVADGATHIDTDDAVYFKTDAAYETVKVTPRQFDVERDNRYVGPPIPAKTQFRAVAVGRQHADGSEWVVTPWLTRVALEDLAFVGPWSDPTQ